MTKKPTKKFTRVREHPRHVAVSLKNPSGFTIVDEHLRRLPGTYLDPSEIEKILKGYDRKGLIYPTANNLGYKDGNRYDESVAIWTDYFNKKFNANPPLNPNVVKALIASESGFEIDPPGNKIALGIAQITKPTLKTLQDPDGEAKDFIFNNVRQRDLKNPDIAVPMAVRWLFRKRATATSKLKREPTSEELILEYKGLLKSTTSLKEKALLNFRKNYEKLNKK